MTKEMYDVVIVGGGPAGLYSSFSCGMRQLNVKLIEASATLGGRLPLYQEQFIWDLGGAQGQLASDIAANLIAGAKQFPTEIVLDQKVEKIRKEETGFSLTTQDNLTTYAKTVILASSLGIIQPRKLKIAGSDSYSNLHYLVVDVIKFRAYANQTVLLYGNPDSISDYVILLQNVAKSVILVTKKSELPNSEKFLDNVSIFTKTELTSLNADEQIISSVTLSDGQELLVSHVFVHLGMKREASAITFDNFEVATVDQHGHAFIQNQSDTTTDVPGLFVVGDLGGYSGKNYMLAACLAEGAEAAAQVAIHLDETTRRQLIVSTHNDIFKEKNDARRLTYFN